MASVVGSRGVEVHSGQVAKPPETDDPASWSAYFEALYRDAEGDAARVPWGRCRPNPLMTAWMNCEAPGLIRPGARVIVVGCGLGDDVKDLSDRGYDTIAFDVSPTAVQWAGRRYPALADRFLVADLFELPSRLVRHADLVVEANTIQALRPSLRERAAAAVASLARPRGTILMICRGREHTDPIPESPPHPLSAQEAVSLFGACGWSPLRDADDFLDGENPPVRRVRVAFKKAGSGL